MEYTNFKSVLEKLINDCELQSKEFEVIGFESSASCSKAMAYAYKTSLDLFYKHKNDSIAIDSFVDYLEKDIKLDQESDIKNKQLKDILFHEKNRILQKAKFFKKYYDKSNYDGIMDNFRGDE